MDSTQTIINDKSDSIEIGTPAKGGSVKVYGDSMKPDEFMVRVNNMFTIRAHAQKLHGEQQSK